MYQHCTAFVDFLSMCLMDGLKLKLAWITRLSKPGQVAWPLHSAVGSFKINGNSRQMYFFLENFQQAMTDKWPR